MAWVRLIATVNTCPFIAGATASALAVATSQTWVSNQSMAAHEAISNPPR